jgi:hypothetical protein
MFNIDKFITVIYLKQVWTQQDVLYACHTGLIFHYINCCEALYQIYKMYNEWLLQCLKWTVAQSPNATNILFGRPKAAPN